MTLPKILSMNSLFFDFTKCKFRRPKLQEISIEKKMIMGTMTNVEETYLDFQNFMNKYCGSQKERIIDNLFGTTIINFHHCYSFKINEVAKLMKSKKKVE